jgi:hypothetical protein
MTISKCSILIISLFFFFVGVLNAQQYKKIHIKHDTLKVSTVKKDSIKISPGCMELHRGLLFQESKNDLKKTK